MVHRKCKLCLFNEWVKLLTICFRFCRDFAQKLSAALSYNTNSQVHTLDLSHNMIEDKGTFKFIVTYFFKENSK